MRILSRLGTTVNQVWTPLTLPSAMVKSHAALTGSHWNIVTGMEASINPIMIAIVMNMVTRKL